MEIYFLLRLTTPSDMHTLYKVSGSTAVKDVKDVEGKFVVLS